MRKCDRRWWYGVIAFAALLVAFAPASQAPRDVDPLLPLWEVRSGGNTVYLLGSIHLGKAKLYPLDPAIYEAFDAAQTIVFELEYNEILQSGRETMTRGMLPEGRTLADVLPADLYAELERKVAGLAIPFDAIRAMEPWAVVLSLVNVAVVQGGFDAMLGIEMHFYQRAHEAGKPIRGLETLDEQIDIFDGMSEAAQIAYLRSTLADLDSAAVRFDRGLEAWRRGEVEWAVDMINATMRTDAEVYERMLTARNRRWVPQIEELLRSGEPAMVIVGLGHLVGEDSVVEMLRERGYTVTRVPAKAAVGV